MTNLTMVELEAVKELTLNSIQETRNNIIALYDALEEEFNRGKFFSQERADKIQADIKNQDTFQNSNYVTLTKVENLIAELNTVEAEITPVVEKSVIEVIAEQLFEQGYFSEIQGETITVTGHSHDLSLTVLDNGYALETYCSHGIEHFKTYEWANQKIVKTLKGLNGYLRRFGFGEVTL